MRVGVPNVDKMNVADLAIAGREEDLGASYISVRDVSPSHSDTCWTL